MTERRSRTPHAVESRPAQIGTSAPRSSRTVEALIGSAGAPLLRRRASATNWEVLNEFAPVGTSFRGRRLSSIVGRGCDDLGALPPPERAICA
jgi:hypothetical protein